MAHSRSDPRFPIASPLFTPVPRHPPTGNLQPRRFETDGHRALRVYHAPDVEVDHVGESLEEVDDYIWPRHVDAHNERLDLKVGDQAEYEDDGARVVASPVKPTQETIDAPQR